jgi:hypothetical protein
VLEGLRSLGVELDLGIRNHLGVSLPLLAGYVYFVTTTATIILVSITIITIILMVLIIIRRHHHDPYHAFQATPLHAAAEGCSEAVMRVLLDARAVTPRGVDPAVMAPDAQGATPLDVAVARRHWTGADLVSHRRYRRGLVGYCRGLVGHCRAGVDPAVMAPDAQGATPTPGEAMPPPAESFACSTKSLDVSFCLDCIFPVATVGCLVPEGARPGAVVVGAATAQGQAVPPPAEPTIRLRPPPRVLRGLVRTGPRR